MSFQMPARSNSRSILLKPIRYDAPRHSKALPPPVQDPAAFWCAKSFILRDRPPKPSRREPVWPAHLEVVRRKFFGQHQLQKHRPRIYPRLAARTRHYLGAILLQRVAPTRYLARSNRCRCHCFDEDMWRVPPYISSPEARSFSFRSSVILRAQHSR